MSKAEKFIEENTRNCSQLHYNSACTLRHCITPDQARKAVEIAREEVIEWINNHWREYINVDADGVVCFGLWKNDFKQAMKDE